PARWPKKLAGGALAAGIIMLMQALFFLLYESGTSRSHELPAPIAILLKPIATAIDIDAGVVGTTFTLSSMRKTHPLGATWELLIDPATFLFLMGGITFLIVRSWARESPSQ